MTTEKFRLDRLQDNPWNERPLDQENVDRIALSIKADTLLQPPVGRFDPADPGRIQLAFGHHRVAAYRKLQMAYAKGGEFDSLPDMPGQQNPWSLIDIEVREIDDRTMARYAIVENHHRADPSAIEVARALVRLTGELKMTQVEAGQLVGLKTQSSVSHITDLLKLPEDVQQLVHSRQISQAAARALLPIMRFQPAAVSKIAKDALEEEPDDRSEAIYGEIRNLLDRKAQSLAVWGRPWPLTWPEQPIMITDANQARGEPSTVPACKGCQFAVLKDPKADPQGRLSFCLRKPCFDAKGRAWARQEVLAASQKLGIPVSAAGETVSVVFAGSYQQSEQQRAARLVRAKLPELRLMPRNGGQPEGLQDVLGTKSAMLVTTSNMAVTKYLNESKGQPIKQVAPKNESPAQAEKRKAAEVELREERVLERIAFNRSKADVLWLVEHTAQLISERTVAGGGLLCWTLRHTDHDYRVQLDEFFNAGEALAKRANWKTSYEGGMDRGGLGGKASTAETDKLRRAYLAYHHLAREIGNQRTATAVFGDLAGARKQCEQLATEAFGIDLPAGWDVAPIHHTPVNCWTCGQFSPAANGKLTQSDTKEGWVTDKDGTVHCPEHVLKGKPMIETFDMDAPARTLMVPVAGPNGKTLMVPKTAKPDRRTSKGRMTANAAAAAQAATRAQALAGKVKNVHGHKQPAPKPSAKKTTRRKTAKKGKK